MARLNQKVGDLTKATSAKTIATQLTKDTTIMAVVQGLNDSQPAASTKPIVPPVREIKTFPEQKKVEREREACVQRGGGVILVWTENCGGVESGAVDRGTWNPR